MDRTLVAETPPLYVVNNRFNQQWDQDNPAEWRNIGTYTTNQAYLHSSTIDLGGYTRQDDLTVFFRSSFEQKGGTYNAVWQAADGPPGAGPINGYDATISESIIISSVPLNDDNVLLSTLTAPGFTPAQSVAFPQDYGNFDRTVIIHGRRIVHGLSTTFGAMPFNAPGEGFMLPLDTFDFSSLEPTAADTLYVYRLIFLPRPSISDSTGLTAAFIPPRRIMLDSLVSEEPDLSYMMRLKRSYELANQV